MTGENAPFAWPLRFSFNADKDSKPTQIQSGVRAYTYKESDMSKQFDLVAVRMSVANALAELDGARDALEAELNTLSVALEAGDEPKIVLTVAKQVTDKAKQEQDDAITVLMNTFGEVAEVANA